MDANFVGAVQAALGAPEVAEVGGRERLILPPNWKDATPNAPMPLVIEMYSLAGLRDYLATNDVKARVFVHVDGPAEVDVFGDLGDIADEYRRYCYVRVNALPTKYVDGEWRDIETTIIRLQTSYVPSASRDALISVLSSVTEGEVRESLDDGYTQEVKTRRGVTLAERTKVPSPVVLAPYRTFREVEQPTSSFVVRLRGSEEGRPTVALYEADGSAWVHMAIQRVGAYLRELLKDQVGRVVLA